MLVKKNLDMIMIKSGGDIKAAPEIVAVVWLVDWVEELLACNVLGFLVRGSLINFALVLFVSVHILVLESRIRVFNSWYTIYKMLTANHILTTRFSLFIVSCHSFQKFYPCFPFSKFLLILGNVYGQNGGSHPQPFFRSPVCISLRVSLKY